MLQAIVFDFDGVLVDSEPLHFRAFADLAAEALGLTLDYPLYLREYVGFDDRDVARHMLRAVGRAVDEGHVAELCAMKRALLDALVAAGVPTIPGTLDIARAAAAAGLPVAIASGATRRDILGVLAPLACDGLFPTIVTADDVTRSKPDPQTYALAHRKLADRHGELDPGRVLAVEDTAAGIAAARGAGLRTLGLATTLTPAELHGAEGVVPYLAGVTLETLHDWFNHESPR